MALVPIGSIRNGQLSTSSTSFCLRTQRSSSSSYGADPATPSSAETRRDVSQIQRLRWLLEAREAKVQAVLDEALGWLITPFPFEEGGTLDELSSFSLGPAAPLPASQPHSASPAQAGLCPARCEAGKKDPEMKGEPVPSSLQAAADDGAKPLSSEPYFPPSSSSSKERESSKEGEVQESTSAVGTPLIIQGSSEEASGDTRQPGEAAEVAEGRVEGVSAQSCEAAPEVCEKQLNSDNSPVSVLTPWSLAELDNLDFDAWTELDLDDELHEHELLAIPRLLAAAPVPALPSAEVGVSQSVKAVLVPSRLADATQPAGVESPKRKRGRPKGSGKKKTKLSDDLTLCPVAAPASTPVVVTAARTRMPGASAAASRKGETSRLKGILLRDEPGEALEQEEYYSNSPGSGDASLASSGKPNSPPSLWSTASTDLFPALGDLLDVSGDSHTYSASHLLVSSPATPSSRPPASCFSSRGMGPRDVLDPAASGSPLPTTPARGGPPRACTLKRLDFGASESEVSAGEDAPTPPAAAAAAALKKSSKGKTGRPRGRPRKIRPNDRPKPVLAAPSL